MDEREQRLLRAAQARLDRRRAQLRGTQPKDRGGQPKDRGGSGGADDSGGTAPGRVAPDAAAGVGRRGDASRDGGGAPRGGGGTARPGRRARARRSRLQRRQVKCESCGARDVARVGGGEPRLRHQRCPWCGTKGTLHPREWWSRRSGFKDRVADREALQQELLAQAGPPAPAPESLDKRHRRAERSRPCEAPSSPPATAGPARSGFRRLTSEAASELLSREVSEHFRRD